jgi:hypothetical protein
MRFPALALAALLLPLAAPAAPEEPAKKGGFSLQGLTVDPKLIVEGGPGKDGIRSVDDPVFVELPEATWLAKETELLGVQVGEDARGYPVRMLEFHQIVNDEIGGQPIAVSYDPLAATPLAWSRRVDGKTLTFGVSGLLYNHNFLMYDRETQSLWCQFLGRAIAGPLAGKQLARVPIRQVTAGAWLTRVGDTGVLRHPDPEHIHYAQSPYSAYWLQDRTLFPVAARDERYHAKELVLGVVVGNVKRAYLGSILTREGGKVDERIKNKRVNVRYSSETGTFDYDVDPGVEVTESYWLAWKAFHPDTEIWRDKPAAAESAPK